MSIHGYFNHKSNGATLNHASGPWRDRMSAIRVSKFPLGCGEALGRSRRTTKVN
ncbi:predicted protein [Escherichia albertii]|nr:predicted protein [Escherichia albertii]